MLIIILNLVNLLCLAGLFFFLYVLGMSQAYNTSGIAHVASLWEKIITSAFPVLIMLTIVGVALSHVIDNKKFAIIASFFPTFIILIIGAAYYIQDSIESKRFSDAMAPVVARIDAENKRIISQTSKDYTNSMGQPSFLTVDASSSVIVYVNVETIYGDTDNEEDRYNIVWAIPVGKIKGKDLAVYSKEYITEDEGLNVAAKQFVDKEGKTIFDSYNVFYKPGQDSTDYHLEKYIDPKINQINISN